MKKLKFLALLLVILFSMVGTQACRGAYYSVPVVKSRKHFLPYKGKRDKHKKRVRTKRYRALKRSNLIQKKDNQEKNDL